TRASVDLVCPRATPARAKGGRSLCLFICQATAGHGAMRSRLSSAKIQQSRKIVNLCFDVVPPRVDGQYFAMGDVAISLINITHLRDALSKGQVINEAETP